MNELKPEDVMRALECCSAEISTRENCSVCPMGGKRDCMTILYREALALLREKNALLAEWDAKLKSYGIELMGKDAEIERLSAKADKWLEHLKAVLSERADHTEAVSEAITEFAERIKTFYHNLSGKTVGGSVAYHIDMIAKELKEVPNDKLQ